MASLPDWRPLDRAAEAMPGEGVIGIVATREAVEAGWAASGAAALAKSWTDAGRRVMLVDAAVDTPSLHGVVGLPNGVGLSDAVLYGASVAHVAAVVESGPYFLIPAGTAVADAGALAASPRWSELMRGFVEAGVTVGLYVGAESPATGAFLREAAEIALLAHPADRAPGVVSAGASRVAVVTGPVAAPTPAAEPPLRAGTVGVKPKGDGGRTKALLLVLLVVVLAVVVLGLFGVVEVPLITPLAGTGLPPAGPGAPTSTG